MTTETGTRTVRVGDTPQWDRLRGAGIAGLLGLSSLVAAAALAKFGPLIVDLGSASVARLRVPLRLPTLILAIAAVALFAVAIARLASLRRVPTRPVVLVAAVILVGLGVAVLLAVLHLQSEVPLHTRNGWLFFRGAEFSDLADTRQWRKFSDPYAPKIGIFYAPAGLGLLDLLSRIPFPAEYLVFAVLVLGATAGAALAASAGCRRWVRGGLVIAFLLSYATQFGLERGNLEAIGLVLLVPAALAAEAGFSGVGGAIAGVFASLKLVGLPLLLGAGPRRARWLLSGLAMVLVLHVSASMAQGFGPVDSARAVVENAQSASSDLYDFDIYAHPNTSVQFSSSVDSMFVAGAAFVRGPSGVKRARPIVESSAYLAIKLLLVGLACLWAFFFDDKQWRRVAIVYSCYILVPPVSYDYKLVLLLVPLMLLLRSGAKTRVELAIAVSLALALIPKAYWYLGDSPTSTTTVLGPLTILLVLLLCLGSGIADRIRNDGIEATPGSEDRLASAPDGDPTGRP